MSPNEHHVPAGDRHRVVRVRNPRCCGHDGLLRRPEFRSASRENSLDEQLFPHREPRGAIQLRVDGRLGPTSSPPPRKAFAIHLYGAWNAPSWLRAQSWWRSRISCERKVTVWRGSLLQRGGVADPGRRLTGRELVREGGATRRNRAIRSFALGCSFA
jgi:hypothetical protein